LIKVILFLIVCVNLVAAVQPMMGDTAELRIWYSSYSNTSGDGINGKITLKSIQSAFGGANEYRFVLIPPEGIIRNFMPTPAGGISIGIVVMNRMPSNITDCSGIFKSCQWITGFTSNYGLVGIKKAYFPLLPRNKQYERDDHFTIRLNDTTGLFYSFVSGERVFKGIFKKYASRSDRVGTNLDSGERALIYVRDNPFRLGGIVLHSDILREFDAYFKGIGMGYYGMTIGVYHSAKKGR
jgi:hypothetical protein